MSHGMVLLKQHLKDCRWLLLAISAVVFVFCWLHVVINAQIDTSLLQAILSRVPNFMENLSPVPFADLMTFPVRLAMVYEEPLLQLMMVLWCITRSSDVVAGEISRGTMELLLAQPIRRASLLWSSVVVTLAGVLLLASLSFAGTSAGILTAHVKQKMYPFMPSGANPGASRPATTVEPIPLTLYVNPRQLLPCALNYASMGIFVTGLGVLVSAYDRYRWRVIGILTGFYVIQHLIELAGRQLKSAAWIEYFSILKAYEPARFTSYALHHPGSGWDWWIFDSQGAWVAAGPLFCDFLLVGLGFVFLLFADHHFRRCDIPAPI
jgi:ABC-2 type transport system permease protein